MILIDTNVLVYAANGSHRGLLEYIENHAPSVSAITYVEALGYHRITAAEKAFLESFFAAANIVEITSDVLSAAVELRQQRKMSLGDSLIAGTALVNKHRLATCNLADFRWISGLSAFDPRYED